MYQPLDLLVFIADGRLVQSAGLVLLLGAGGGCCVSLLRRSAHYFKKRTLSIHTIANRQFNLGALFQEEIDEDVLHNSRRRLSQTTPKTQADM